MSTGSEAALLGSWVRVDDMSMVRRSFAAVPLVDGRVLVVGNGFCGEGDPFGDEGSERVELLDPATGRWTPAESLNAPRDGFIAVRLLDGRVLVSGGVNRNGVPFSSTKLFDPATGHWSATGLLNKTRWGAAGALLPDGRILVAGGLPMAAGSSRVTASAELYDPSTDRWTTTGSLRQPRDHATAYALPDGRVAVIGGWREEGVSEELAVELYDPRTGTWTETSQLPRLRGAPVLLDDGSILFVGGAIQDEAANVTRPVPTVWRFDPVSGNLSPATPMPTGRMGGIAARLDDGRVLVAGGTDQAVSWNPEIPAPRTTSVLLYDPARDVWAEASPMPFADDPAHAVLLADGSIVVVGGTLPEEGVSTGSGDCANVAVAWAARFLPASTSVAAP